MDQEGSALCKGTVFCVGYVSATADRWNLSRVRLKHKVRTIIKGFEIIHVHIVPYSTCKKSLYCLITEDLGL
jgi:hypothetical protein